MFTNYKKHKVFIAGAGPAGLAASLTLSAYKIPHCIVDANITATQKLGDALPPNSKPLLKQLGISELLNHKKHIPYYGNQSIWGSNKVHEKEFIKDIYGHGYLLDRQYFENQLRQLIKANKTPFYKGYHIKRILEKETNISIDIQNKSEKTQIQSQYIIDATGRKASICRHLGAQKKEFDSQLTISFKHQLQHKISRQIWIEATENGWWYLSPNANGEVNCMFFTLLELIPSKNKIVTFLENEIKTTLQIQKIIKPTEEELLKHKSMPSGTSYLTKMYGKNWLAVGDAAFSYDPISSYGITSSLASGYYGAHALSSKLANEEDAFLAYSYIIKNATKAYFQKLAHQYNSEKRWRNSYYWKNRFKTFNETKH